MAKAFASGRGPAFAFLLAALSAPAVAVDTYEDKLISTPGTPDVVAKGLEADGYALGVLAYTWAYPLVRMERVAPSYTDVPSPKPATSYRAPLDQIGWATELATPSQGHADREQRHLLHERSRQARSALYPLGS
jgi:hypothetical protein